MSFIIHPLLRLTATQPQLLADHAEAYAELISAEVGAAFNNFKRRATLNAAAISLALLALFLAGVAVMLWAVTPVAQMHQPLALFATPLLPGIIALGCWWYARGLGETSYLDEIRQQLKSDFAMLRKVTPT